MVRRAGCARSARLATVSPDGEAQNVRVPGRPSLVPGRPREPRQLADASCSERRSADRSPGACPGVWRGGSEPVEVLLPNGMVVTCHQKHEVPLVQLEVQSYFGNGVQLKPGDTMFDVGANIGLFSLAAYHHCDRDLRIFAFEPVAAIFDLLQANCERNAGEPHVNVFRCGLSDRSGTADLAYYPRAPVLSTAYPDREADLKVLKEIVVNSLIHLAEAPLALRCLCWVPRRLRERLVDYALRRALVPVTTPCQMRTLSEVVAGIRGRPHRPVESRRREGGARRAQRHRRRRLAEIRQVVVEVHDLDHRVETTAQIADGSRATPDQRGATAHAEGHQHLHDLRGAEPLRAWLTGRREVSPRARSGRRAVRAAPARAAAPAPRSRPGAPARPPHRAGCRDRH